MNEKQISLLAAFLAAKVDYAVVGGMAVNVHGYVRPANDLDIFIRPTEENVRAAFAALGALGVPLTGLEPADLLNDPEENLRFGPDEDHVDILASIGELSIPFISRSDLIENKLQIRRLRDLADIEELSAIPPRLQDKTP